MARPTKKLTSDQIAQVEVLAAFLTVEQMADYFCISRKTFYNMMEKDQEINTRYKRGQAATVKDIASNLITKAREGDMTAIIFFLKTRAGWRETQKFELTGEEGGPIITEVVRRIIDPKQKSD